MTHHPGEARVGHRSQRARVSLGAASVVREKSKWAQEAAQ